MTLRTVTYDDSKFKIVPIEPTEAMCREYYLGQRIHGFWNCHPVYVRTIAAAPEFEPMEMPEDLQRDWKGIDGAIAYHLIDRYADNWGDVGQMMDAWLKANQSAPEYKESE